MQISGIQTDVSLSDVPANLKKMEALLRSETKLGTRLIVFPECFVTGYCFDSLDEARQVAEPLDGTVVSTVAGWCQELNCITVFGMLELAGNQLFNALVLVGPNGLIGSYRKTHLPFLGVDRFSSTLR